MRRSVMCMAVFLAAAHMGWAAETAPDPAAFPRMIFLHNMWWSGPGSPRFIPGGAAVSESPHAAAASGHYENAPLIPPAARDAAGNALSHEDGRRVQVFRDARMAGIDAVIYDCFSDRVNTYIALFRVAEAARLSGSGVRVCPCADRMPGDGLDFLKNLWEYRDPDSGRLLREHPNLLRTGGRPIVFEYHKAGAGVWAERLQRMQAAGGDARVVAHAADGINSAVQGRLSPAVRDYIAFAPAAYLFASHARAFGNPDPTDALGALVRTFDPPKAFGGPVAPGYVGTTRVGNLLDPRGTWLYRLQWTSRIRGNPDFVHLTTGNDYSETEQECSANSTFTFMDLTRYFGTRWRTGAWPEPDGPQAFLSYRTTVARRERAEFELVLLRPELTGDETEAGTAGRFEAECRVHTSWGETVALPPAAPRAALGHVVWRFRLEAGFDGAGWGRPEVSLRVDGEPVALPDGPAAGFGVMDDGEELA
ncbi:MAG: hypothetical protein JW951_03115, partial [Lentisphaerae bacterium]|nr:hypothetical protein [Lentisphaerota bacterium]